jgi:pimeloyl-ACP methyl ester carboxylesterase
VNDRFGVEVAGGITLAAERWTADGPPVVLLQAGVCDRRSFTDVGPALPADVVAYDRRGFGQSPADATAFRHLDDLYAVLDVVAPGTPVWLVGNSLGGALAIDAALERPDRIAGLVLIAPAITGEPDPETLEPDTQRWSDVIDAADEAGDLDALNDAEVALWLDGPAGPHPRVPDPARALARDMNGIALRSGVPDDAGDSGIDAYARIAELGEPTTLTWGDLDLPLIVERCERLAQTVPAITRTHVFTGTAHLPTLERPAEVADVIAQALRV